MNVLVANLNENRSRVRKQVARDDEAISKVPEIAMDSVAPRVAKGFHLLGLTCDVCGVPVPYVSTGRRPLKVRIEPDPVGRVDVNTLHFASQAFALSETGHHL